MDWCTGLRSGCLDPDIRPVLRYSMPLVVEVRYPVSECTNRKKGDGIVVLGGYGAVGRAACAVLGESFPGRVLAAGRDSGKAEAL